DVEHRVLARLPAPLRAARELVAIVRVLAPEIGIAHETVALLPLDRQAPGRIERFDRPGRNEPRRKRTELGDARFHGIARDLLRLVALHDDQTGERIRAEARPLRSAQHLDASDIEQRRRHADAAEIDIVDEKADRGIRRALALLALADAAHLEIAGA